MLLLSDGTVMGQRLSGNAGSGWSRLTPDSHGSYVNGTWSNLASMHDARLYFASQVLRDGRVFVAGGEYGTSGIDAPNSATAEVYDPLLNVWTLLPSSGQAFRDAISEILPDGSVLIAPVFPSTFGGTVIYNPTSNTWSAGPTLFRGYDQAEASWVKLPDDSILTIDPFGTNSERYIPSLNQWIDDGTVPVSLYDSFGSEIGAGFLLADGRAFFLGSTGHTTLYTPTGTTSPGTWAAGPDIPNGQGAPDAAAAMMVNGKILCAVSPVPTAGNVFKSPTSFYEYDPVSNSFTRVNAPTGLTQNNPCYYTTMLDLPDGTVLHSHFNSQLYVYQPTGSPLAAGKPTISSIIRNADGSYHLTGTKLNGISEGASYGDDAQMNSNYPIIRLTDAGSNVYYARTYNWSSTGVMTGNTPVTTEFKLPAGLPVGTYSLVVVANGISSDPVLFDTPPMRLQIPPTATEGDGLLAGQGRVIVTPAPTNDLVVTLTCGNTSEITVSSTATVLAGQTNATFDLTVVNDAVLDGDQNVSITAAASSYPSANATIIIHDNETATLTVTVPATATEGQGALPNAGTVTVSAPVGANVTVNLSSSDPSEVLVPSTVTILTGQTTAVFSVTIVDDNQLDGSQTGTITAHVANWTDGAASITVLDNENTNLTVTLPVSAYEGDGVLTNAGRIDVSGTLLADLSVTLQSSDTTELSVPASVTILAGQTNATFNLTIVEDALQDGAQNATVTASASGFANGNGTILVKDNDASQFVFSNIASPQSAGTPFATSVAARDINGSTITVYQAAVNLSGSGNGGSVSIQPATITAWTNGVWTGSVRVNTADESVRLSADDGAGHTGLSNPFNVYTLPTTILVGAANLQDGSGNLAPTSCVAVLVVDTGNNGFADPQSGFPLNVGATWGTDDKIVGLWDLRDSVNCLGNDGGALCAETVVSYTNGIAPGQGLQLYWFPSLALSSNTLGVTFYGKYTDTNSPPLDGSDVWQMPAGGSSLNLYFLTAYYGGSNPETTGRATLPTAAYQSWQMQHFGCTTCPQAAENADPDGDGQNNQAEFLTRTDPTNSASAFRVVGMTREGDGVRIAWATTGGLTNAVQIATNATTNFIDLSGLITVLGSGDTTTSYVDVGGATNSPARFYRVRLVP